MECNANFSILGVDNIFVRIGLDNCTVSVLEILLCACFFGVLNLAIYHAACRLITWLRWLNLKMATRDIESLAPVELLREQGESRDLNRSIAG